MVDRFTLLLLILSKVNTGMTEKAEKLDFIDDFSVSRHHCTLINSNEFKFNIKKWKKNEFFMHVESNTLINSNSSQNDEEGKKRIPEAIQYKSFKCWNFCVHFLLFSANISLPLSLTHLNSQNEAKKRRQKQLESINYDSEKFSSLNLKKKRESSSSQLNSIFIS